MSEDRQPGSESVVGALDSDMERVADLAAAWMDAASEQQIYEQLGAALQQVIGEHAIISVSNYDLAMQIYTPQASFGLGPLVEKLVALIGMRPIDLAGDYPAPVKASMATGLLTRVEGGVVALAGEVIPPAVCHQAVALLGLHDVFVVGFARGGCAGGVCIICRRPGMLLRRTTIETLTRMAAIAIERARTEQALRESEQRHRIVLSAMSDVAYSCRAGADGALAIDWMAGAVERITGCTIDDIEAKGCWGSLVVEDDRPLFEKHIVGLEPGATSSCELRIRQQNGSIRWLTAAAKCILKPGSPPTRRLYGGLTDITDRKHAEEMLRESEQRFRAITDNMREAVWLADLSLRTTWISPSVSRMSGYSLAELAAMTVDQLLAPASLARTGELIAEYMIPENLEDPTCEISVSCELEYICKDGGTYWVDTAITLLRDKIGKPEALLGVGRDISDRKRAEEALRESEAQLSNALKIARAGSWEYDVGSDTFTFNDNFYRIFRTTADEVGGYQMSSTDYARRFCHPDDAQLVGREVQAALETADPGYCREFEHRIRYADGAVGHITVRFFVAKDQQGRTIKTYGVNQDVTGRRQAENALRASETRYRRLFESAKDGVLILDAQTGAIVDVNPFLLTMLGFSRADLLGKKIWDLGFFKDFWANQEKFLDLQQREYVRYEDLPLETADGRKFDVEFVSNVYLVDQGKVIQCNIRDITARKRAEGAARASEARFRNIFDQVQEGILLADPVTHEFSMANRTMCEMLGYTEQELLRLGIRDIHPEADLPAVEAIVARQTRGEQPVAHDMPIKRKDGTVFYADISAAPITIDGRAFMMGSFRDVTERRALEASVAQADRLASMGMLAAGVAHEVNNPLAYVLGNVENLAEDLPRLAVATSRCCAALQDRIGSAAFAEIAGTDVAMLGPAKLDDAVAFAREALDGARRIKEIVRGLSSFSRVEQAELSAVDLKYTIESAISMAFNEIKYRARLVYDFGQVPAVRASMGKLAQVFLNLLINACHAIEEGDVDNNRIAIRTWSTGDDVFAEVADTGRGVPPEILQRIFEPFFSTKKAGTGSGLGLAICRNIITEFGGEIGVESQVGSGTRFTVRLPARPTEFEQPHVALAAQVTQAPVVRGRILVVDDEPAIRSILKRLLGRDHEVAVAASGEQAQVLLEADHDFDVILCDLMMPEVTGMDLHSWLVGRYPAQAQQVVFITGGAFTPKAAAYLARAGNLKIEKPFDGTNLKKLVSELVVAARSKH